MIYVSENSPMEMRVGATIIPVCILGNIHYLGPSTHSVTVLQLHEIAQSLKATEYQGLF